MTAHSLRVWLVSWMAVLNLLYYMGDRTVCQGEAGKVGRCHMVQEKDDSLNLLLVLLPDQYSVGVNLVISAATHLGQGSCSVPVMHSSVPRMS